MVKIAAVAFMSIVLGACSLTTPAALDITCQPPPNGPQRLTCGGAIAAAAAALRERQQEVIGAAFHYGTYCGQGCRVPIPDEGYVIVTFRSDPPVIVFVQVSRIDGAVDVSSIHDKAVLDGDAPPPDEPIPPPRPD